MENFIKPSDNFDFSLISLGSPKTIQGGAYFTNINFNSNPLYIITPKCLTKQGFIKNGKKIYTDLMFNNDDEELVQWFECLETKCQELIFDKKDLWFNDNLEKDDIETAFASPIRIYKSGKFYLVRVNFKLNPITNNPIAKVYDENEYQFSLDDIINIDNKTYLISIIEVQGIKFTSKNFQIELEIKQSMVLKDDISFDNCLIKKNIINENNTKVKLIKEEEKVKLIKEEEKVKLIKEEEEKVIEEEEKVIEEEEKLIKEEEKLIKEEEKVIEEEEEINDNTQNKEILEIKNVKFQELYDYKNDDDLREVELFDDINKLELITLKKPNEVYYNLYKEARKKAKISKINAIKSFLEAKNIKKTYMLDDLEDSDSDGDFDFDFDNV